MCIWLETRNEIIAEERERGGGPLQRTSLDCDDEDRVETVFGLERGSHSLSLRYETRLKLFRN